MKRVFLISLIIVLAACKKNHITAPTVQPANKMTGKWTITSVTVIPRDSTGKAINNGTIYTEPAYYYFQFNADNTWVESLGADPAITLGESGSYTLHADTGFTLINVNLPSAPEECKIASLSDTSLKFSHQKATLFDGVTKGYLEYLFKLER